MWNGIGGKMEPGEDPLTACVREVREETGITFTDPRLCALLVITIKSTGDLWIIYVFSGAARNGAVIESDEGELRWISPGEISTLQTPADLPLILPHILKGEGVLVGRVDYASEDAVEPLKFELTGS